MGREGILRREREDEGIASWAGFVAVRGGSLLAARCHRGGGEGGLAAGTRELQGADLRVVRSQGLNCIFCIGEKLSIREQGIEAVMKECAAQLEDVKGMLDPARVVIAYEPVWSIGTGVTASPEQAQETHKAIREWLAKECGAETAAAIRIQYGGSANAKNAPDLSACPDVDGFLVGGASLKPEFKDIVAAISAAKKA